MRSSGLWLSALIGLSAVAISCSDSPSVTSPTSTRSPGASRQLLSSPAAVSVVTRNVPLAESQSTSAVIGIFGGRLSLPGTGLTVVVPPFAVTTPTTITVTAVAGREVAYEFEPHGTQFLVPLRVTQSLSGTSVSNAGLTTLSAGYFQSIADLDQSNGTALVSELLGTSVSLWSNSASFSISHFSGYLIGTGFAPTDGDGSQ
jgi:hypothetical protein